MKTTILTSIAFFCVTISGCADLRQLSREGQAIPVTFHNSEKPVKESGAIYLWPPYSSAAVVDKQGKHCVLAASGVKTLDSRNEAALKIAKAFEKVEGLDTSAKSSIIETFTKLSAADSKAAFADIALFHLCMLEQNGAFKDDEPEKRKMMMDAYIATIHAAQEFKPEKP